MIFQIYKIESKNNLKYNIYSKKNQGFLYLNSDLEIEVRIERIFNFYQRSFAFSILAFT
jgi:hypothetical protein